MLHARIYTLLLILSCSGLGQAQTESVLVNFNGSNPVDQSIGRAPMAPLLQAADGNFYGTTSTGGPSSGAGAGTVFKLTPGGTLTTLYSFDLGNVNAGESPYGGLILGGDGNFYGTTNQGGSGYSGTIFKITPDGSLTTLYAFTGYGDGSTPYGELVQDSAGNFYGTTSAGGINGLGTVFRLTPGGALTTLVNFDDNNGNRPKAGLTLGTDGNFYGTTFYGGSAHAGTVFKLTPSGSLTTLVNFDYNNGNGGYLASKVIQGTDGNFYGTTTEGGSAKGGTVFRLTPGGELTTLANFESGSLSSTTGGDPFAALVEGRDGNFYGTTIQGGSDGSGTIFQVTPGGTLTVLYNFKFPGNDVQECEAALIQASDGNFYGTSLAGGDLNVGTIFKFSLTSPTPPPSSDPFSGTLLGGGYYYSTWFGIYNSQFYPWDYRTDIGFFYVDPVGTDLYLYVLDGNPAPMGWLYTNSTIFPNVYSFTKGSFLYYFDGTTSFANYTTGQIETY